MNSNKKSNKTIMKEENIRAYNQEKQDAIDVIESMSYERT